MLQYYIITVLHDYITMPDYTRLFDTLTCNAMLHCTIDNTALIWAPGLANVALVQHFVLGVFADLFCDFGGLLKKLCS